MEGQCAGKGTQCAYAQNGIFISWESVANEVRERLKRRKPSRQGDKSSTTGFLPLEPEVPGKRWCDALLRELETPAVGTEDL